MFKVLTDPEKGVIRNLDEIDAVGHRVVHGMEYFNKSVLITPEVIARVKNAIPVAPLHNPANITGIEAILDLLPEVPQVGSLRHSLPSDHARESLHVCPSYEDYEKYGIRRYGFPRHKPPLRVAPRMRSSSDSTMTSSASSPAT